jgi:hypothetical protein
MLTQGVFYSTSAKVMFGSGATERSRAKMLNALIRACDDAPYPTNELAKLARIIELVKSHRIVLATAGELTGVRLMVDRVAASPSLHPMLVPAAKIASE